MASLDGCLEKCRRADEHLELFQAEADAFVASHPYGFPGTFLANGNEPVEGAHGNTSPSSRPARREGFVGP